MSDDTSVYYEDYTPSLNENVPDTEWPVCKKRRIHAQEKIIQEKPIIINNSGYRKSPQNEQQNDNQIQDQKHYKDALTLTHIQPPNLSDSDSNDTFPITISTKDKVLVYRI